jgi:hypothetical protein
MREGSLQEIQFVGRGDKTHLVAMPTIKIRVRTPARQVMLDVDDGITVADLKKKVSARD